MAIKNPPLKKFGANVRRLRESLSLSQEQLADEADIHRTFISGIERGVRFGLLYQSPHPDPQLELAGSRLQENLFPMLRHEPKVGQCSVVRKT